MWAHAGRLVSTHVLRTADALQLAAALICMRLPQGGERVVSDPYLVQVPASKGW